MKYSIIQQAGRIFLSTATGFCFLSAEAGLSQDATAPLLPPRPAIRPITPAQQPERAARPIEQLPLITPGSSAKPSSSDQSSNPQPAASVKSNPPLVVALPGSPGSTPSPPGEIHPENRESLPQIVPLTAPMEAKPSPSGPAITPGPTANAPVMKKPTISVAFPPGDLAPLADSGGTTKDTFEMPILSEAASKPDFPKIEVVAVPLSEATALAVPAGKPASAQEIGLEGCCPVTLRDKRQQVPGSEKHASQWRGMVYHLASGEAKQRFDAHPELYAPAKGGLDVIQIAQAGQAVPGSLEHAVWYRRQLYLFQDAGTLKAFTAYPEKYVKK